MKNIVIILTLIFVFIMASMILAAVPEIIHYQGYLTDDVGDPVNGPTQIKFKIYMYSSGTDSLWSSGFRTVQVSNGTFNYILGSNVALPDNLFRISPNRYLGITVGTDSEISPRLHLGSVPFAYYAQDANRASVADEADWAELALTDSDWAKSGNNLYSEPSGNVGIGISAPPEKLHVVGSSGNYGYMGGDNVSVFGETANSADTAITGSHTYWDTYGYIGGPSGVYAKYGNDVWCELASGFGYAVNAYNAGAGIDCRLATNSSAVFARNGGNTTVYLGEDYNALRTWTSTSGNKWAGWFDNKVKIVTDLNIDADNNLNDRYAPLVIGDAESGGGFCLLLDGNQIETAYTSAGLHINTTSSSDVFLANGGGDVGIGTLSPSARLTVSGSICYTGSIYNCSDARYKTNISKVDKALNRVMKLRGVTYNWKKDQFPERNFSSDRQIGFIAQEIKEIIPEAVMQDDKGFYNVDYNNVTPLLVEAIKDQQMIIEQMQKKIEQLENKLNNKL